MKNQLFVFVMMLSLIFYSCQSDEVDSLTAENDPEIAVEDENSSSEEEDSDSEEETSDETSDEGETSTEEETTEEETQAPGTVEEESQNLESGSVSYQGRIPSENSKVPTCKSGSPNSVIFIMTDSAGTIHEERVPASESDGLVSTTASAAMPLGQSIVNEILLMNGNDTLYAIPDEDELDLARFADVTVPFNVNVTENTELTGGAFCYTQQTIDIPDDALVDGGFGTQRLQTLWIDVKGECIDIITVTIDNFRVLEIFPFQNGLYDIPIPENYERMDIRAYTPEFQGGFNDFESFTFTASEPYNADGDLNIDDLVQFEYDCPPEEIPEDDEDF